MSFARLIAGPGGKTVTVVRRGASARDTYNTPGTSETSRSDHRGWVEIDDAELTIDRATVLQSGTVYLPPGVQVDTDDQLIIDGKIFDVDGIPDRVAGARGEDHVEVRIRGSER